MNAAFRWAGVALFGLLAACSSAVPRSANGTAAAADVVRAYFAAINRQDQNAATALLASDVQWLAIEGGRSLLEADGREAMQRTLGAYFAATPDARSEVEVFARGVHRVAVYECVRWRTAGGSQRRCAHGLFEVQGEVIQRVWFWPAESAPS
ncbi:MAG: nuclear transport factor 2 family protein [Xanthomonadales bacterium]|nr:nuclear transport factor 2 family protein [Xanthomonadales bacterium]